MVRAVIFDMDGVLIDSEPLHFSAIEAVLKKYGVEIDDNYLDKFVGDTNERAWEIIKKEFDLKEPAEFYINQQIDSTVDCLWRDEYKPIDGVVELLELLKKNKYTIGVASSSPPSIIENILDRIGVAGYFDKWVSGNEVEESKPAPFIYLRAAELLGFDPVACVAVEDSFYGVTAAKAAGMKCIGYKAPHAIDQDLSAADLVVDAIKKIDMAAMRSL